VAERGGGTTVNDRPLTVSTTTTLDGSLLATGFPYNIREARDNNPRQQFEGVRGVQRARSRSAADGLGRPLPRVEAAGRLDGYWELRLGSWDVAAGSRLVEEAGGRITGLTGGTLDLDSPSLVASAAPRFSWLI
jgi:myo-inositol-1(or 4)-monophosphatase